MALPVRAVSEPSCLAGLSNGRIPDASLVDIAGQAGGPLVRLVPPAARAWKALCAAALVAGHTLKASGLMDSYRPYSVQERIFRQRYTTNRMAGRPSRMWNGVRWYQRPGTAAAAVPGDSNHGKGIAVDVGVELDGDTGTESMDHDTLAWLVANEQDFGWSHEIQSEAWHIRYFSGDHIPAAVLAFEDTPGTDYEELLMAIAKDDTDAVAAWTRTQMWTWLGRGPGSVAEFADHTKRVKASGADAYIAFLTDSAEGKSYRRKLDALIA